MASGQNGTKSTTEGRAAIIEYEAFSGVLFHITPVNLPTLRAIQVKAESIYPYPEKEGYQLADENVFGGIVSADENPDYLSKCREIDTQRGVWADRAVFDYAVKMPKYPTKQDLVRGFQQQLDELRAIATLPEDDYEAILHHIVLTWNQLVSKAGAFDVAQNEYSRIVRMAMQTVPLTPSEVTAGIRFFRAELPEHTPRIVPRQT